MIVVEALLLPPCSDPSAVTHPVAGQSPAAAFVEAPAMVAARSATTAWVAPAACVAAAFPATSAGVIPAQAFAAA